MTDDTRPRHPDGWQINARPRLTRRRTLAGIALVAIVVGWVLWTGRLGISARIRWANSALVEHVDYGYGLMGDRIDVYLVPGATRDQAHQVWCDVIRPAAGSAFGDLARQIVVWSSEPPKEGVDGLLADSRVTCP